MSGISLEPHTGPTRSYTWGRKDEEYIADFCLVSRRTLDELEHRVFRYHYILGADWRLCSRKLGIERGSFFHALYRIEQKLGRVFRQLEPYPLFPLDEYYFGPSRTNAGPRRGRILEIQPAVPMHLRFPALDVNAA